MNRKYHVQLSEVERKGIQELMVSEKTAKGIKKRCNILLQADENAGKSGTQAELSVRCGVSDVTVLYRNKGVCHARSGLLPTQATHYYAA